MAKEISIKEWLKVIKKRIWMVIIVTVVLSLAGYLYGLFVKQVPLYQSSARVVIGGNANNLSTLEVMVKDPTVLTKVSNQLNHLRSPGELNYEIAANNIDSSQVISISVVDQNPKLSAEIANTTASVFKREAADILQFNDIRLLSEAKVPSAPINPVNHHKVLEGFGAGVILGIGLALLLNAMDDTVQTERGLEMLLEAPVFGSIAKMTKKNMYKRRKIPFLRKGGVEFSNVSKVKFKKKSWPFFKSRDTEHNESIHKESKPVHRIHQAEKN